MNKILASVLTVLTAFGSGFLLWAHAHGAEPITNNATNHTQLASDTASGFVMGIDIERKQRLCDKIRDEIESKRDQELQIMLSPERSNPAVIEASHRIKNEIKDLEKMLENEMDLLHDSRSQYKALIDKIRTV